MQNHREPTEAAEKSYGDGDGGAGSQLRTAHSALRTAWNCPARAQNQSVDKARDHRTEPLYFGVQNYEGVGEYRAHMNKKCTEQIAGMTQHSFGRAL